MSYQLYVAGPWADRDAVNVEAEKFRAAGYNVQARWLTLEDTLPNEESARREGLNDPSPEIQEAYRKNAMDDIEDLLNADLMVLINSRKSEGKAVELGIAIATLKPVVLVGPRTNVFHTLNIPRFDDTDGALAWMKEQEAQFEEARAAELAKMDAKVVG